MSSENPVVLVDGSSFFHRAWHRVDFFVDSNGRPMNAVHGVANMMESLQRRFRGSEIIFIMDASRKCFRNEIYPAYKANRPPTPEDLRVQIKPLVARMMEMGFKVVMQEGVEADDVIGVLSEEYDSQGLKVIIATGDKDLAQLVTDNVTLLDTKAKTTMDREGVIAKFGVPPERVIDWLAIGGDSADNIPGAKGIGPKGAVLFLQAFPDGLRAFYDLDDGKDTGNYPLDKVLRILRQEKDNVLMSYTLATVKTDFVVEFLTEKPVMEEIAKETEYATLVGSRDVPANEWGFVVRRFIEVCEHFVPRSGHAFGTDTLAEMAATRKYSFKDERVEIYLPYNGFNKAFTTTGVWYRVPSMFDNYDESLPILESVMPWVGNLNEFALNAHRRNVYQVHGQDLKTPSKVMVIWAPWANARKDKVKGGTATAFALAKAAGIPVFNLFDLEAAADLKDWLKKYKTLNEGG